MGSWKRRLSDDEQSVLLSELLLRHPELAAEAEELTSTLLVVNDRELAGKITTRLRALRGPVSVGAGRGRLLEVLQPYIDDLTRRKERGARRAAALAAHLDEPAPFRFAGWDEAITRLMRLAVNGPKPVVINEFPSHIQRSFEPAAQRRNTPVRLLLCGSALSFMGKLLAGSAPLRGRAGLELLVPTLDYRLAREFWGISDLRTAMLTNAIVGGTPAYRREFAQDDVPAGPSDFDQWICRTVLNPGRPLLREARYILAEEPDIHDTALYHAVLAAIAEGNTTRGGIANYLARKSTDLAHPLGILHDAGLITHETEAFKRNRSAYRIAEPLLTFYHAIMRPAWGDLERPGRAPQVWRRSQHAFHAVVAGPHFEEVCRQWARWHAGPQSYGGAYPARVASGTVSDPEARKTARPQKSTLPSSAAAKATATCCSPSARRNGSRQCPPAT